MLDVVRDAELLVHHPFDAFDATVVRFLRDAAADPDVTAIKITLYRVGHPSPVVDALLAAAHAGKKVVALVELKARFDEEHNVGWARALERAGGHVVYGLVGLKVHAKVALVVRREGERLRRYVHVGTGNYSARSGRQYTDLSLFSARDSLTADASDLFNELTGSSRAPQGLSHGALVAPHQLLPAVLTLIEGEAEHARAGRAAAITIKVNGLSDPEVVRALYHAAQAGVRVDLVVRGICTLRPGVPGLSPGIRVVSVVGRFLEHSRVYRFANGGDAAYLIGSSDLRPRNLRRRVELLVPVLDAAHRAELDRLLALYLDDPTAWELTATGSYVHRSGGAPGAQETLAAIV
jgi:polyphosphate kinase